ncbi:hypothetical protein DY000_02014987 [Brassica cretica]|nr:hypothetical protein DY000_02014987 [Brassica cretica]
MTRPFDVPQSMDQSDESEQHEDQEVPVEVHSSNQTRQTDQVVTGSTRERPDWSFNQIHDQTIELTELKLVFPGQLDNLRLMVKPEST